MFYLIINYMCNNNYIFQYLEIARTLKFYGYIRFNNCTCDYPELGTETVISIGQRDMIFTPKAENMSDKETKFRITKIRCWKITPLNVSMILLEFLKFFVYSN